MIMVKEDVFTVKGYWSDDRIFNGSIYKNNSKFGTVNRILFPNGDLRIHFYTSFGKEERMKDFKKWLIKNKLTSYNFFMQAIDDYVASHPNKRLILI